jgi:hypothetical protein
MKRMIVFLVLFLLPQTLCAMSPLTDSDLSKVKTLEISTMIPDVTRADKVIDKVQDDADDINNYLKISKDPASDSDNPNNSADHPDNQMNHSMSYPYGSSGKVNEDGPKVVDTPVRSYSTGRGSFVIKPASWVDVKVR